MAYCNQCCNVVFHPQISDDSQDFVAVLHPSLEALKESAGRGSCDLCTTLWGMILHRDLGKPRGILGQRNHIELSFSFFETGDWAGIDDDAEDTTKHLAFLHPLGVDSLCILNSEAISRSGWLVERDSARSPVVGPARAELAELDAAGQLNESTGSDASLALAASWVRGCQMAHLTCKRSSGTGSELPKRLLDVSGAAGQSATVYLVCHDQQAMLSNDDAYATLSHRWNAEDTCVTTTKNLEAHIRQGISVGQLPRTIAEACLTCNRLGIRYIWIDSLCILQDSDSDKLQEIPKMGMYYQNSEINISASTAGRGLWRRRDGRATKQLKVPVTVNLPAPHSPRMVRITLELAPVLHGPRSQLDSRGWILQERIFSRRTLFFDPYWISFLCRESSAAENCTAGFKIHAGTRSQTLESDMGVRVGRDCSLAIMGGMLLTVQDRKDALGKRPRISLNSAPPTCKG